MIKAACERHGLKGVALFLNEKEAYFILVAYFLGFVPFITIACDVFSLPWVTRQYGKMILTQGGDSLMGRIIKYA